MYERCQTRGSETARSRSREERMGAVGRMPNDPAERSLGEECDTAMVWPVLRKRC